MFIERDTIHEPDVDRQPPGRSEENGDKAPDDRTDTLERLSSQLLVASAFLFVPALAISLSRVSVTGFMPIYAMHILVTSLVVGGALARRRIGHAMRVAIMLVVLIAGGAVGTFAWGLLSHGPTFMAVGAIIATLLLGARWGVAMIGITIATVAAVAAANLSGAVPASVDFDAYVASPTSWALMALMPVLVAGIVGYIGLEIRDGLLEAVAKSRVVADELAEGVQAVRQSEQKFKDLVESTSDWVWEVDAQGRYTYASPKSRELLGREPEDMIGKTPFDFMAADEAERIGGTFASIVAEQRPFEGLVNRNVRADGTEIVLETSGVPVFDDDGALAGYRGIDRDVTERKAAENRLRTFSRIIQQTPESVIITNARGTIEYVNEAFTSSTGYSADDALGKTPALIKSGATPPEVYERLWRTISSGGEWDGELQDVRKDGRPVWFRTTIMPVRDDDGAITHFVALQRDITERKMAEITMRDAAEKAEIASRAKTELLANMSHELRTPLNAIIGFSEIMRDEAYGPLGGEPYREYARDIHASGTHLLSLINDILDMSAIEAGKMALHEDVVSIPAATEACRRLVAWRAELAGVAMTVDIPDDIPDLCADERRFKQIVLNLLSNAVKFTPEGGTVSLSARRAEDDGLALTVSDSGIGMSGPDIAVALEPFGQVDSSLSRKFEGTGLGLPLVKRLTEMHGGTIKLESEPGRGTSVTVHFPADRTA